MNAFCESNYGGVLRDGSDETHDGNGSYDLNDDFRGDGNVFRQLGLEPILKRGSGLDISLLVRVLETLAKFLLRLRTGFSSFLKAPFHILIKTGADNEGANEKPENKPEHP